MIFENTVLRNAVTLSTDARNEIANRHIRSGIWSKQGSDDLDDKKEKNRPSISMFTIDKLSEMLLSGLRYVSPPWLNLLAYVIKRYGGHFIKGTQ